MWAGVSGATALAVFADAFLVFDFCVGAVANIGAVFLDQALGELVKLVEVVA